MTVSSETQRVQYTADGSQDTFQYTFRILAEGNITVIVTDTSDNDTTQTLGTDYSVTGVGDDLGGNVVFSSPPTDQYTITIYRDVALTQTTAYVENDPFPASSHENALDKLTFFAQQIQDELDRSVKVPVSDPIGTTMEVPNVNARKNKYLQFDANGDMDVAEGLEADAVTFENLDANADVGTGSDQVAQGNHNHSHLNLTNIGSKSHATIDSDIAALEATDDDITYELRNEINLDQIQAPSATHTFNMASKGLNFSFTNPDFGPGFDHGGAFEIAATGAFTGDLVHIHQHVGNPGAGTRLLSVHAEDADVIPVDIIGSHTIALSANGEILGTNITIIQTHVDGDGSDHSLIATNTANILSVSGASDEGDNRLQEQIDVDVLNLTATSGASIEQDNRLQEQVDLNNTHRTSDGTDHGHINQDVTTTGTPTFTSVTAPTTDVSEKLVIPTDEPSSLEEGCIWIA